MSIKKAGEGKTYRRIPPTRMESIEKELKTAQVQIEIKVLNLLNHPVRLSDNNKAPHVIENKRSHPCGTCLVLQILFNYDYAGVKINADLDYSEEYTHAVMERYSAYALSHVDVGAGAFSTKRQVSRLVMLFDSSSLKSLNNVVSIPEFGLEIDCNIDSLEKSRESEFLKQNRPVLTPDNGCANSGTMVTLNDPHSRLGRAFYRFGEEVLEIHIDRTPGQVEGVEMALWNKVVDPDHTLKEEVLFLPIDSVLSGENEIGFKIFSSLEEAFNSPDAELRKIKDEAAKEKVKQRDEKRTNVREEKLKFGHGILKIFNEVVKTTVPIIISWGGKLLKFIRPAASWTSAFV